VECTGREQVSGVAIQVDGIEEVVSGRADIIRLQYRTAEQFPLDAKKLVLNIRRPESRVHRRQAYARPFDPVVGVQTQLERGIDGITGKWLRGISQAVSE
jgi:hypothetical protein